MTTIIWNYGKLFADRRVSVIKDINGFTAGSKVDDAVKLFEPKNVTINGRKVLAMGFTGDAMWINLFPVLDRLVPESGLLTLDVGLQETFADFFKQNENIMPSVFMCVTAKRVYAVVLTKDEFAVHEYLPTSAIIIGSPTDDDKRRLVELPPFMAMQEAMLVDEHTGGNVHVWQYGKTGISEYELPKERSKHKPGKLLMKFRNFVKAIQVMRIYRAAYKNATI